MRVVLKKGEWNHKMKGPIERKSCIKREESE